MIMSLREPRLARRRDIRAVGIQNRSDWLRGRAELRESFPYEIKAMIFVHAAMTRADRNALLAFPFPLNLLLVDSSLGDVFCNFPNAWGTFTIPAVKGLETLIHIEKRVNLYLRMSKDSPLRVQVQWRSNLLESWCGDCERAAGRILAALKAEQKRWTNVRITLQSSYAQKAPSVSVLGCESNADTLVIDTPLPYTLISDLEEGEDPGSYVEYVDLECIPKCRRLSLSGEFKLVNNTGAPMVKLTMLRLSASIAWGVKFTTADHVLELLEWFPALQVLQVDITSSREEWKGRNIVKHNAIRQLHLRSDFLDADDDMQKILDNVSFPALTHLHLENTFDPPSFVHFLEQSGCILTDVGVASSETHYAPLAYLLSRQPSIATLTVRTYVMYPDIRQLVDALSVEGNVGGHALCPSLTHVSFYSYFSEAQLPGVLRNFILSRWKAEPRVLSSVIYEIGEEATDFTMDFTEEIAHCVEEGLTLKLTKDAPSPSFRPIDSDWGWEA